MFTSFEQIFAELSSRGARKRMVVAWGVDGHTIAAASMAIDAGLVDVTLVGDASMIDAACAAEGVDVSKFTVEHNSSEADSLAVAVSMM